MYTETNKYSKLEVKKHEIDKESNAILPNNDGWFGKERRKSFPFTQKKSKSLLAFNRWNEENIEEFALADTGIVFTNV